MKYETKQFRGWYAMGGVGGSTGRFVSKEMKEKKGQYVMCHRKQQHLSLFCYSLEHCLVSVSVSFWCFHETQGLWRQKA